MDTNFLLKKLISRQPVFDEIPAVHTKRIMGLESEYGYVDARPENDKNIPIFPKRFLPNGGLAYRDSTGHPEYATPEVSNPLSAVLYYEAGKMIFNDVNQNTGNWFDFFCNNNSLTSKSDSRESNDATTFGSHENYSTSSHRDSWKNLIPFLIARTIMSGNGWLNKNHQFEISQRASFIRFDQHADTTQNRAIINTKNEDWMSTGYSRMHIICGDATMNQVSTLLRVGTMSLMVELNEIKELPKVDYNYDQSSRDIQGISRRTSDWYLGGYQNSNGNRCLISLLYKYLEKAKQNFANRDMGTNLILAVWEDTLERLGRNPMELGFRLDWVAKKLILEAFQEKENWTYDWLQSQDQEYHNLDPNKGLYYIQYKEGQTEKLFTERLLQEGPHIPPSDTRAYARGNLVKHFKELNEKYFLHTEENNESWDNLKIFIGSKGGIFPRGIPNPFLTYSELLVELKELYS